MVIINTTRGIKQKYEDYGNFTILLLLLCYMNKNRHNTEVWDPVVEKVVNRLSRWFLSRGGRMTLMHSC